jgi:pimeloyl-ACP methyl ester carboxylesterase
MVTRDFAPSHDGLRIRYEIRGEGDPVAMIMGFSGSMRGWGDPFVERMEKQFKCVFIDNRGTGESDKPDQPWTMNDMAADIASVLDHAKIDQAHIFGISMGGMIAQTVALNYPARTRGLVLGCTNAGASHSIPAPPEAVASLIPDPNGSPEEQARKAFAVACGRKFLASKVGQDWINQTIAQTGAYPITPMHTFMRQMAAIAGGPGIEPFDSFSRLGEIKSPTLIIHGDDDRLIPWRNANVLQGAIAGSRIQMLKDIGHMFFWEAHEESARAACDFLAAVK